MAQHFFVGTVTFRSQYRYCLRAIVRPNAVRSLHSVPVAVPWLYGLAVLEARCWESHLHQCGQLVDVGLLQVAVPQLRARLPDLLFQQQLVVLLPLQLHAPGVQLAAQPAKWGAYTLVNHTAVTGTVQQSGGSSAVQVMCGPLLIMVPNAYKELHGYRGARNPDNRAGCGLMQEALLHYNPLPCTPHGPQCFRTPSQNTPTATHLRM